MSEHRKRIQHYDEQSEIHELTFSCYQRWPLLEDNWRREQLSLAVDRAMEKHGWRLVCFVYMPEHVHLLVCPDQPGLKIAPLLFAMKRPFSYRVKQQLVAEGNPLLKRLTVRQRPQQQTFRFWQEGPGYDRNIRSEAALFSAIDSIHLNPVRRGFVACATDYCWSSARWYASDRQTNDPLLPRLSPVPSDWFAGGSDFTS